MTKLIKRGSQSFSDFTTIECPGGFQMQGLLTKRPMGRQSNKWSKRFFVLKDGFLFYYAEAEKKFDGKSTFNIHPKGVIPLGDCSIEEANIATLPYGICIQTRENNSEEQNDGALYLGADSEDSRQAWIRAMERSAKITTLNTELGETMIRSLQEQILSVSKDRQDIFNKFVKESEELNKEREKIETLEEFNLQLAEEKIRIQMFVDELQDAQESMKSELDRSLNDMNQIEEDRNNMLDVTVGLQKSIQELSHEKMLILDRLDEQKKNDEMKSAEAQGLAVELMKKLDDITEQTLDMEKQKEGLEKMLIQNEEEKSEYRNATELLRSQISELEEERRIAQDEMKAETAMNLKLKTELQQCRVALQRLQQEALSNVNSSVTQDQVMTDVKSLLEFFETCVQKNKIEMELNQFKRQRMSKRLSRRRSTPIKRTRTKGKKRSTFSSDPRNTGAIQEVEEVFIKQSENGEVERSDVGEQRGENEEFDARIEVNLQNLKVEDQDDSDSTDF